MLCRNIHTVFYGLPFLTTVNTLTGVMLRGDDDREAVRISAAFFLAITVIPMVYIGRRHPEAQKHHGDCLCKMCRAVWIPTLVGREYPLLRPAFTVINYIAFGVSLVECVIGRKVDGAMTIEKYATVCFLTALILTVERFMRMLVLFLADLDSTERSQYVL